MDLNRAKKKFDETKFFLAKLKTQESRTGKYPERFDFYLSAFLSAAKSVEELFQYEVNRQPPDHRSKYNTWHREWKCKLSDEESHLIDFMVKDRNIEVHTSGSKRLSKTIMKRLSLSPYDCADQDRIKSYISYYWKGTKIRMPIMGSPKTMKILREHYYFNIEGRQRSVIKTCTKYAELRGRMLAKFEEDYSEEVALYDEC
jgi:hypothetical protein